MEAILLDMYGVVVKQTGDDFVPFVRRTFPEKPYDEIYDPWLLADVGAIPSLEIWRRIGFTGDLEKVEKEYLDTIELNDAVLDFLKEAKKHYRLALLSNDSAEWSRYLRQKFGLDRLFDAVCVSGEQKIAKPDRRVFLWTAERLGVKPENCWFVDDRESNLQAAEELGMKAVLLNSRHIDYDGDTIRDFADFASRLW